MRRPLLDRVHFLYVLDALPGRDFKMFREAFQSFSDQKAFRPKFGFQTQAIVQAPKSEQPTLSKLKFADTFCSDFIKNFKIIETWSHIVNCGDSWFRYVLTRNFSVRGRLPRIPFDRSFSQRDFHYPTRCSNWFGFEIRFDVLIMSRRERPIGN